MRVDRVKNFITQAECDALNAWADEAADKKWMDSGLLINGVRDEKRRLTTRFYGDRFEYPPLVLDIRDRIAKAVGIEKFPLILDHGKDGVVVNRMDVGGDLFAHLDRGSPTGELLALRCNILTRKPAKGGALFLEEELLDIEVGELHCYTASTCMHRVSIVEEGPARVLWMFGAYVPVGFWE
jgi:hypothetical protein